MGIHDERGLGSLDPGCQIAGTLPEANGKIQGFTYGLS